MLTPHLIHQPSAKEDTRPCSITGIVYERLNSLTLISLAAGLALMMLIPATYSETNTQIAFLSLAQTQSQAQEKINQPVYDGIDSVIAPYISRSRASNITIVSSALIVNDWRNQKAIPKRAIEPIGSDKVIHPASKPAPKSNESVIKPQLVAVKLNPNTRANNEITVARLNPVSKQAGAQNHFQSFDIRPAHRDNNSKLLLQAIADNDTNKVYALIVRGADVNSRDQWGWTALLNAAIKGNLKVVNFLLERGANPNIAGKDGRAPIIAASWNGYPAIVASLIKANADVNLSNRDGWTALSCAAWNGDIATTRLLLSAAADTSIQTYERQSAIQLAMERGHAEVISLLK